MHEDRDLVARLVGELETRGETVWWDKKDLLPGALITQEVTSAVHNAYAVVLCVSRAGMARRESGVFPEWHAAVGISRHMAPNEHFLVLVRLDDVPLDEYGALDLEISPGTPLREALHLDYFAEFTAQECKESVGKLVRTIRSSPRHPEAHLFARTRPNADLGGWTSKGGRHVQVMAPKFLRWTLDHLAPRVHRWLTRIDVFPSPKELGALAEYLGSTESEMRRQISDKTYLPLAAADVDAPSSPFDDADADPFTYPIHRVIRRITGLAEGGDGASAQIAAVNRSSKIVRNIHAALLKARDPVVLLGDPGMGKTMTLQEVACSLCTKEHKRVFPTITVFLRLGTWVVDGPVTEKDVEKLVEKNAPQLAPYLRGLEMQNRLVLLFDGMDEMSRKQYAAQVRALSDFAMAKRERIKCLFTCRITDFSPGFQHQKMVLLPLGSRQVEEFLLKYIKGFPLLVGGIEWTARRLAKHLVQGEFSLEPTNPFVLFLLCGFLQKHHAWPSTRMELMESFCEENWLLKMRGGPPPTSALSRDDCMKAWGEMAYIITRENLGSNILISALGKELVPADRVEECALLGKRCGVLALSREDAASEQQIRFQHHRFQEFFTARHMHRAEIEMDWEPLIDAPRWQETMFNLVLLGGGTKIISCLAEILSLPTNEEWHHFLRQEAENDPAPAEAPSTAKAGTEKETPVEALLRRRGVMSLLLCALVKKDPENARVLTESQLADRAELASRMLRHVGPARPQVMQTLGPPLNGMVQTLVSYGNPITQVKMLRASQNVPGIDHQEVLKVPLQSHVAWVQNQAMIILGAFGQGGRLGRNLPSEMLSDLGQNRLFARLKTYVLALRSAPGPSSVLFFVFVSFLQMLLISCGAVAVAVSIDFSWVWLRRVTGLLHKGGSLPASDDTMDVLVELMHWGKPMNDIHATTMRLAEGPGMDAFFGPAHLPFHWLVGALIVVLVLVQSGSARAQKQLFLLLASGPALWAVGREVWRGDGSAIGAIAIPGMISALGLAFLLDVALLGCHWIVYALGEGVQRWAKLSPSLEAARWHAFRETSKRKGSTFVIFPGAVLLFLFLERQFHLIAWLRTDTLLVRMTIMLGIFGVFCWVARKGILRAASYLAQNLTAWPGKIAAPLLLLWVWALLEWWRGNLDLDVWLYWLFVGLVACFGLGMLALLLIVGGKIGMGWVKRRWWLPLGLAGFPFAAGMACFSGLLLYGMGLGPAWSKTVEVVSDYMGPYVVVLLALLLTKRMFLVAALYAQSVLLAVRPRAHRNVDAWRAAFVKSESAFEQAVLLSSYDAQNLRLKPEEFLKLLESVEGSVLSEEPAMSTYWELRSHVDELVRHDSE